jgi:hypothetical protein
MTEDEMQKQELLKLELIVIMNYFYTGIMHQYKELMHRFRLQTHMQLQQYTEQVQNTTN